MIGTVVPAGATGHLMLGREVYRCALGRGGVRAEKAEGDGATPFGPLPLRRVLFRADRLAPPPCAVPLEPIGPADGWCDDPADPAYNRPVSLPYPGRHEELWRTDGLYDVVGVLGWNDAPVVRGRGSAIFLHVARPDYAPTAGCVALMLPDLLQVLRAGLSGLEVRAG
ncbi:L,D-transpeptidase family protein [Roseomonas sp. BN140053]|uniref:L,D-transpeptidase family protein n=1 Tax=Roseomonas sp. BN140053 TaxID=3391898 RepID=UPI0039ECF685